MCFVANHQTSDPRVDGKIEVRGMRDEENSDMDMVP